MGRDTGQSIERMGCRAQDNWIFQEKFCRHRAVMNLFDQKPKMAPNVFVAPNASVIGNVEIKPNSSIWCVPHLACVCIVPLLLVDSIRFLSDSLASVPLLLVDSRRFLSD